MFAFHVRLTEACGNPLLEAAMTPILDLVEPVADLARRRARERSSPAEQSEILAVMQAVKARDPARASGHDQLHGTLRSAARCNADRAPLAD
jgi:DNA-binding FadR family transcriptional regulator